MNTNYISFTDIVFSWPLGISCGPPPPVENAVLTSESHLFEDIANYSCEPGFEVSDGVVSWSVSCQSDTVWSEVSICSSEEHCLS